MAADRAALRHADRYPRPINGQGRFPARAGEGWSACPSKSPGQYTHGICPAIAAGHTSASALHRAIGAHAPPGLSTRRHSGHPDRLTDSRNHLPIWQGASCFSPDPPRSGRCCWAAKPTVPMRPARVSLIHRYTCTSVFRRSGATQRCACALGRSFRLLLHRLLEPRSRPYGPASAR